MESHLYKGEANFIRSAARQVYVVSYIISPIFANLQKEMEHYKEDEAKDYWLVQFQRLLDSKPQVLVDDVSFVSSF